MLKKISALSCVLAFSFAVSGCGGDKGKEFVGKWVGEDKARMGKPSFVMDIIKDDEVFHVNLETTQDILGYGKPEKSIKRFEAKAESDSVLSMAGGLATMRKEGEIIYFDGTTYTRSK